MVATVATVAQQAARVSAALLAQVESVAQPEVLGQSRTAVRLETVATVGRQHHR